MHGPGFAREVMNFLDLSTASGFVRHFTPQFHFRIITADPDDDIFADCAIAADAEYSITEDGHFKALRNAGDKPQRTRRRSSSGNSCRPRETTKPTTHSDRIERLRELGF